MVDPQPTSRPHPSASRLARHLGASLRHQRELRGLRQDDLARRAGMSQAAVARIERADRGAPVLTVERLFAALGLRLTVQLQPLDADLDVTGQHQPLDADLDVTVQLADRPPGSPGPDA